MVEKGTKTLTSKPKEVLFFPSRPKMLLILEIIKETSGFLFLLSHLFEQAHMFA